MCVIFPFCLKCSLSLPDKHHVYAVKDLPLPGASTGTITTSTLLAGKSSLALELEPCSQ